MQGTMCFVLRPETVWERRKERFCSSRVGLQLLAQPSRWLPRSNRKAQRWARRFRRAYRAFCLREKQQDKARYQKTVIGFLRSESAKTKKHLWRATF